MMIERVIEIMKSRENDKSMIIYGMMEWYYDMVVV